MNAIPMTEAPRARPPLAIQLCVLLLASLGVAALWTLVSLAVNRHCAWMAAIAAVDAAVVLRFMRMPAGILRIASTLASTAITIVVANWWIAGNQIGGVIGLPPWDAVTRMGPAHAWTLAGLANGPGEWAWYGVALIAAVVAAR